MGHPAVQCFGRDTAPSYRDTGNKPPYCASNRRKPDNGKNFNENGELREIRAPEYPDSRSQDIRTNSPDRGLGSKQVDLGGMTSLASATAINSPMDVG